MDVGRSNGRSAWSSCGFTFDNLLRNCCDLIGRLGHVLEAVMIGKTGERLSVAWPKIFVPDLFQPRVGCRCQQQRTEMNVLSIFLALADNRYLLVNDIVRCHRT